MHKIIYKLVFVVIAAAFIIGVIELFSLRFERGDVYPAYSSLRSDPLGTKVLFNSLENFRDISVVRNYRSLDTLEGAPHSILLYLGAGSTDFDLREKAFFQSLDQYVIQGGELVISFIPTQDKVKQEVAIGKKGKKLPAPDPELDEKNRDFVSMEKHWGIVLSHGNLDPKKNGELVAKKVLQTQEGLGKIGGNLPPSVPWHSTLSFRWQNNSWRTLYNVNGKPVMAQKLLGRGSILLISDSFFFSNEALLKQRQVPLLSALFQDRNEIIFDEYHLGVVRQHGLIDLMVKYRLHYFLVTLFFIFLLLIWKNSSLPVPEKQGFDTAQLIESKKDYFEGLVSLLRKNIAVKDILKVCIEQWFLDFNHSSQRFYRGTGSGPNLRKTTDEILISLKKREIDPIKGYQLIYKKLKERI